LAGDSPASIKPRKRRRWLAFMALGLLGGMGYFVIRAGGLGADASLTFADGGASLVIAPPHPEMAPSAMLEPTAAPLVPAVTGSVETAQAVVGAGGALDADLPPHAAEPNAEATVVPLAASAPTAIPVPPVAPRPTVPASVERTGGEVAKQNVVHKASAPAPTPAKKKPAATTKKRRRP
jgi:hypothetical protein